MHSGTRVTAISISLTPQYQNDFPAIAVAVSYLPGSG